MVDASLLVKTNNRIANTGASDTIVSSGLGNNSRKLICYEMGLFTIRSGYLAEKESHILGDNTKKSVFKSVRNAGDRNVTYLTDGMNKRQTNIL